MSSYIIPIHSVMFAFYSALGLPLIISAHYQPVDVVTSDNMTNVCNLLFSLLLELCKAVCSAMFMTSSFVFRFSPGSSSDMPTFQTIAMLS